MTKRKQSRRVEAVCIWCKQGMKVQVGQQHTPESTVLLPHYHNHCRAEYRAMVEQMDELMQQGRAGSKKRIRRRVND